jgi:hypothetical protein
MNPRDTQFEDFAKALRDELEALTHGRVHVPSSEVTQLIARRAYDLVFHVVDNSRANDMEDWETERIMPYVPDMVELPKDEQ